ncbi:TolC family protein [Mucilaginibacter glaciei]|uniref:TolC family protein n=1 Tax=Mucilaginibacter glaciei TaxID=2772109 RepID=A0A926NRW1_9SPHI|nr:TolC family protein [Mucilaginibacter glaciei]MBD1392790.1 TolC family protein [Mucilaginibacter glaciei]
MYTKTYRQYLTCCLIMVMLLCFVVRATAQQIRQTDADTKRIFTLKDLEERVLMYHPIVKQAELLSQEARAKVMQSLGGFDPAIKASFGRKTFGGTDYYNHWDSELKVPLWLAGADLKVGYDRNVGIYNNPETRTALSGLSGIGLNIPLGQGLIIDARRNTLRQAKIMVNYAEAQKIAQINKIWFTAVKDYWNWYYAYRQYVLIRDGVDLAQTRFVALRNQVLIGDKPPIDSVEAAITMQDRQVQLQSAGVELQNARLVMSNHLWSKDGEPQELPETAMPQADNKVMLTVNRGALDTLAGYAADRHPDLLKLRSEGSRLNLERAYRAELLKPKLNINGSFLSNRRDFGSYVPDTYDFRPGNYKVGIDFSFPLFLRAERGKLREVKIQQLELEYDVKQTGREIQTGISSSYNELKAYEAKVLLQTKSVINQQVLVKGELQKFELGESTLFLINSRETKLIDMQIKKAEMIAGMQKSLADLYYKAGTRVTAVN